MLRENMRKRRLNEPLTEEDPPEAMKHLSKDQREEAIHVANQMIEQGIDESEAIPMAIKKVKDWEKREGVKQYKEPGVDFPEGESGEEASA